MGGDAGILDRGAHLVVEYKYVAWGKIIGRTGSLVSTLGYLNPFRYRGYVYDEETGLYYLKSRYYNPVWGRFINADALLGSIGALGAHNIYAYCYNNPVRRIDPTGCKWYDVFVDGWNWFRETITKQVEIETQIKVELSNSVRNDLGELWESTKSKAHSALNGMVRTVSKIGDWWNGDVEPWVDRMLEVNARVQEINAELTVDAWQNVDTLLGNPDWEYIGKETISDGITGFTGGFVTGGLSAVCGAPFTAGASVPVSAAIAGGIGFVGGLATGFVGALMDELWR